MLAPEKYDTDKLKHFHYLSNYDRLLRRRRKERLRILEMGVHSGGSLRMWRDVFPRATIIGLDLNGNPFQRPEERIEVYRGDQANSRLLGEIAAKHAPEGFDLVIDDAAHVGRIARKSFWALFPRHVRAGGVYAIEDWGTAYWEDWPDGRTPDRIGQPSPTGLDSDIFTVHHAGMAGFLKELIDEIAVPDATHETYGLPPEMASLISRMEISRGHAMIFRSGERPRW